MPKVTLNEVQDGNSMAVGINANSEAIEAAIEKTLSRDGTSPNAMEANLDMNSNRILNAGAAVADSDVPTYGQTKAYVLSALGSAGDPDDLAEYVTTRSGLKNLVDFPGFDNTGETDSTANWEAAMAGGGTVLIPPGTYTLQDCDIPTDVDTTLIPMGPVTVQWAASGTAALRCDAVANVGNQVTVTDVTTISTWPVSSNQTLSRINGSFADYSAGDICHIMSDDTTADGLIKGEMFKVLYVHTDDSYLICDRLLHYTYTAGTYTTTVRRFTAMPKVRILPGITFDTIDDPLTALGTRPFGLMLRGLVEPEASVEFRNCYSTSVRLVGVYGGRVDYRGKGIEVNYDLGAFGYGLEMKGVVHGTNYTIYSDGGGHNVITNGDLTTYDTASWYRCGSPQAVRCIDFYSRNCVAAALDSHWSIRPRFDNVVIEDVHRNATVARSAQAGLLLAAVDPWFGTVSIKNARNAIVIRETKGVATKVRIESLNYESTVQSTTTPSIVAFDQYTSGTRPIIEIGGGSVSVAGRFPILANNIAFGYILRLFGVSLRGGPGLVWFNNPTAAVDVEFHAGCTWYPDSTSSDGILRADSATTDNVRAYSLNIIRGAETVPNGLVRGGTSITSSIMVGAVTLDGGAAVAAKTSGSAGTSVVTINKLPVWGERVQAPTGSATLEDDAGTVLMSHTSGTPTITLRDPSLLPGRRVTIKNLALSSGGNVTVATAAGTIDGATTLTAAGKERATYIANGTVWQQIA
jgi:hypothetical protein